MRTRHSPALCALVALNGAGFDGELALENQLQSKLHRARATLLVKWAQDAQ
jgi:hypothetical protein